MNDAVIISIVLTCCTVIGRAAAGQVALLDHAPRPSIRPGAGHILYCSLLLVDAARLHDIDADDDRSTPLKLFIF